VKRCLVLLSVLAGGCDEPPERRTPGLGVAQALGGDVDPGFARATAPPVLQFPRDHGSHPAFRTEWWYVTGNVAADDGARFGVQLVFFRQALAAQPPAPGGSLAARDVILAHAAVTDVAGGVFHHEERLARLAGGLAELAGPAPAQPFRIACADWSARAAVDGDGFLPLDLRAGGRGFSFALRLQPGKPLVLQGEAGLSRKSGEAGNASIYYSMTRMPLEGTITTAGVERRVQGLGWLDREWSTSALAPDQVGWDWFSLQLDTGEDLMWYRLRRADGAADPWSRGCFVDADGRATMLRPEQVQALPRGEWRAPDGGAIYPASFRLVGGEPGFDLEVAPVLADQELRTLVRYWEGAVVVRGTRNGAPVTGRGYLEMTGYTQR
jgi:predicted secreted hydrolase